MGKHKATKVVRKKKVFSSYISISLRCNFCFPTIQMPGISFIGGGGGGRRGVSLLQNFRF